MSRTPASISPDAGTDRWNELYRERHRALRALAKRLLRDDAAAEDVAQETIARAWAHRATFGEEDSVDAWMHRVARNLCVDVLRRRHRVVSLDAVAEQPDETGDVTVPLEREFEHRAVRIALAQLSERDREAVYRRDVEGVSYSALADSLGLSEDATRQTLSRARRGLRRILLSQGALSLSAIVAAIRRTNARVARAAIGSGVVALVAITLALTPPSMVAPEPADADAVATEYDGAADVSRRVSSNTTETHIGDRIRTLATARSKPLVSAKVDTKGQSVGVDASVPVGGQREDLWLRVWRARNGEPSRLLEPVDAAMAGCDGICEQIGRDIAKLETP